MTPVDPDPDPDPARLDTTQFDSAIEAIDEANSADPVTLDAPGRSGPKELVHSVMMTEWVTKLDPGAEQVQLVAARAHHIRRWTRPRSEYPEGRVGYRRWRTAAAAAQADEVAVILRGVGASDRFIRRVGEIIRKEGLGTDPAVQTHEDALCLVFLQTQLDDIIGSLGEAHATEVVARTIPKMSTKALEHAAGLDLSAKGAVVLGDAMDAAKSRPPQ